MLDLLSQENSEKTTTKSCFWNTCPLKLGYFPESECELGRQAVNTKGDAGCPWYINSQQDHYCFWTWVRRVSDSEGFMDPLLQHEIAEFLGCSGSKLNQTYKEALEKLKTLPEFEDLKVLFSDKS